MDEVKAALKQLEAMRFTFARDTFTIKHPPGPPPFEKGREEKSAFRLDSTKTPKQIDLSDSARGIYELDGDKLKLCWDQKGKENGRPTKFAHDKDRATVHYYVLKREKSVSPPGGDPAVPGRAAAGRRAGLAERTRSLNNLKGIAVGLLG
jgi:uncharacterized protein (TIGR03067 family)